MAHQGQGGHVVCPTAVWVPSTGTAPIQKATWPASISRETSWLIARTPSSSFSWGPSTSGTSPKTRMKKIAGLLFGSRDGLDPLTRAEYEVHLLVLPLE